ncbi:hypothetical protein C8J56DRAFT_1004549 [Mycena floridula]|nr:hypothetical protein C8J56DRAFT_1004549 [Mycena floridula]
MTGKYWMPWSFWCAECGKGMKTQPGLRSHLGQSPKCRDKMRARIDAQAQRAQPVLPPVTTKWVPIPPETFRTTMEEVDDEGDQIMHFDRDNSAFVDDDSTSSSFSSSDARHSSSLPNEQPTPPEQSIPCRFPLEDDGFNPYIVKFPPDAKAGAPIYNESKLPTPFESIRAKQVAMDQEPWAPFDSQDDWQLARFIMKSGLSQAKIDEFLKLELIKNGAKPSYHNKRAFLRKIDSLELGPGWECETFEVPGDRCDDQGNILSEEIEFWRRDPLECVKELIANPAFKDHIKYAPEKQFMDEECTNQAFSESWTGEWWWEMQERLPVGSTVAPIILSSDKTQLSRFSGDKQAWALLEPLVAVGKTGIPMMCADGFVRHVYTILMAYIADYPEQCLVTGCDNFRCPRCRVAKGKLGDPLAETKPRNQQDTIEILLQAAEELNPEERETWGIHLVNPFWTDLPHCDIFSCITPDLLHQLHKGVFKEHLSKWVTQSIDSRDTKKGREQEIDHRFTCLPSHPALRHFSTGISLVSQWTGNEYKNMEKVFLGVACGSVKDERIIIAVRSVLDFIYYSHFEFHTTKSLVALQNAWANFHNNKDRLHIDTCKIRYAKSNRRGYTSQMSTDKFTRYLQWAVQDYVAPVEGVDIEPPLLLAKDLGDEGNKGQVGNSATIVEGEEEEPMEEQTDRAVPASQYSIAQSVPSDLRSVSLEKLESDYGAYSFIDCLERFLKDICRCPRNFDDISQTARYGLYRRFTINIPPAVQCSRTSTPDPIRATPFHPKRGLVKAAPEHFDTVIARKSAPSRDSSRNVFDVNEHFVARVRVIFELPAAYGDFEEPLAYVEWFTTFRAVDQASQMFHIKPSTISGRLRTSIIPLSWILRSCHLLPKFGRVVNTSWNTNNVLDVCPSFLLNFYLRHLDFIMFRGTG